MAIVDGEHYPDVVREALAQLPYEFVGVMLIGGTEKLRDSKPDYGVPVVEEPGDAEIVVDLSDEPVLSPPARFRLASRVLAFGIPYVDCRASRLERSRRATAREDPCRKTSGSPADSPMKSGSLSPQGASGLQTPLQKPDTAPSNQ